MLLSHLQILPLIRKGPPDDSIEDNNFVPSNEVIMQSILNLVNIKFDRNIKDSTDPYNSAVNSALIANRQ